MQGRDILRSEKTPVNKRRGRLLQNEWLTHPSKNARYLKYKVEFSTARNFARALRCLKGLGFQL